MLTKLLKRFRVSEVHLCLPFVQITMEAVREETESTSVSELPSAPSVAQSESRVLPPARPSWERPLELVRLAVTEREPMPDLTIVGPEAELATLLSFRIATHVDQFGPIFGEDWQPVTEGLSVRPGDYLWLRLYCQNRGDRVLHHVHIALDGVEIAQKQCGILVRGVDGWPRVPVRDVVAGQELGHINPAEDYSLHCVLRVPSDILTNRKARFSAVKPEFNILKQLR